MSLPTKSKNYCIFVLNKAFLFYALRLLHYGYSFAINSLSESVSDAKGQKYAKQVDFLNNIKRLLELKYMLI